MKIKAEIREDGVYAYGAAGGAETKLDTRELIKLFGTGMIVIKKVKK